MMALAGKRILRLLLRCAADRRVIEYSPPSRGDVLPSNSRCVLVVADELPKWLAVNSAAILGVALAAHGLIPIGPDLLDASGVKHPGIGTTPLPILAAPGDELSQLRSTAIEKGIFVIDFNSAAHNSHTYDEYEKLLADEPVDYLGLALHGPKKAVTSVSGNLKSLR